MKGGLLTVDFIIKETAYSEIWLTGSVNMVFKGVYNNFDWWFT